jgi:predicted  nucleic acid-binding Zn-ribbon protein
MVSITMYTSNIEKELSNLNQSVNKLLSDTKYKKMKNEYKNMKNEVAEMRDLMAQMRMELDEQKEINANAATIHDEIEACKNAAHRNNTNIVKMREYNVKLRNEINAQKVAEAKLRDEIHKHKSDIDDLNLEIAACKNANSELKKRIGKNEADIVKLKESDGELDNQRVRMTDIEMDIREINDELNKLKGNVADKASTEYVDNLNMEIHAECAFIKDIYNPLVALSTRIVDISVFGAAMLDEIVLARKYCYILEGRRTPQDIVCIKTPAFPVVMVYCWDDETIIGIYGKDAIYMKQNAQGVLGNYTNTEISTNNTNFDILEGVHYDTEFGGYTILIYENIISMKKEGYEYRLHCTEPHAVDIPSNVGKYIYSHGKLTYTK